MVLEKSAYTYNYFSFFLWFFPLLFIPICKKNRKLLWVMLGAYLIRVSMMLVVKIFLSDFGPHVLHCGYDDFENMAYPYFNSSMWDEFIKGLKLGAYGYVVFIIKVYQLTGQELWFLLLLNAVFGSLCVFFVYKIADLIYTPSAAFRAAVIMAVWPSHVFYSSLLLRESLRALPLIAATYFLLLFLKKSSFKVSYLIYSLIFLTLSCVFHAGSLSFALGWVVIVLFEIVRKVKLQARSSQIIVSLFTILFILLPIYYCYYNRFGHSLTNALNYIFRYQIGIHYTPGNTTYLIGSTIASISSLYLIPLHSVYFLFYPFIWSIDNWKSLFGGLDAFLYLYFFVKAIIFYRPWFHQRSLTIPVIALLIFSIVGTSLGVKNYGTAMRHRISIAPLLIAVFAYPIMKKKKEAIAEE